MKGYVKESPKHLEQSLKILTTPSLDHCLATLMKQEYCVRNLDYCITYYIFYRVNIVIQFVHISSVFLFKMCVLILYKLF